MTSVVERSSLEPDGPARARRGDLRSWATSGVGFAWIATSTLLTLVVLMNSAGTFVTDIKPEIYLASERMALLFASPWQTSPQLGWASFNVGLAPVPAFVALLHLLGVDPEMSSRVLRLLLLLLAMAGAAVLVRIIGPGRGRPWLGFIAGVLMVANPYTVVGGSTLAVLLPLALLPWMLAALVKAVWHGGWRWPAAAALAFTGMSGMNAGVIPLLQLVSVPFVVWWAAADRAIGVRRVVGALLRWAVLVSLLALYWAIPSLSGVAFGVSVVQNSETLEGINAITSLSEVVRGLGMWSMYGADATGPWQPGFAPYLTMPAVILASFTMLVATIWALPRAPLRLAGAFGAMGLVAAVLMVGLYPLDSPTALGQGLRWLFTEVPVTGAFRTLNKTGSVLVVAAVVLIVAGLGTVDTSRWRRPARAVALLLAVAAVAGSVWPALSGGLYPRPLPIPDYWREAAAAVDSQRQDSRVWLIPGEVQADYTWSTVQPDDLALPLFGRRTILRTVLPVQSPTAANLLAGIDSRLQAGELLPGTLSPFARMLSVGDLVVRNDAEWIPTLGGRPWTIRGQLVGDPGLGTPTGWGRPGQNVQVGGGLEAPGESQLHPVETIEVSGPRPLVRAESLRGALIVSGDGAAMPTVYEAGLMPDDQSFFYLSQLTEGQFTSLLSPDRRLVLTDGNRRVDVAPDRLVSGASALLPADAPLTSSRALGTVADQTVLVVEGGSAEASLVGSPGHPDAGGAAENAFDGDWGSAWQFNSPTGGESVTARFPEPRDVGTITVEQSQQGTRVIGTVRVTAGDRTVDATLPPQGPISIPVDATAVDSLTLTVLSTSGEGLNGLGIREITIPGFQLARVAQMPTRLTAMTGQFDAADWLALASTPIDVVLRRETGGSPFFSPEERGMSRNFDLPIERTFRLYGLVRTTPEVTEDGEGCFAALTVDDRPVRVRLVEQTGDGAAALMTGCEPLRLSQGSHRVRPVTGVLVDRVTMRDSLGETIVTPGPVPATSYQEVFGGRFDVSVGATAEPVLLVAAEAADPRWSWSGAAFDPRPVVVDGGLNGWILPPGPPTEGTIAFGPRSRALAATAVSSVAAAVCLVLALPLLLRSRRRPDPPALPAPPPRSRGATALACAAGAGVLLLTLGPLAAVATAAGGAWWWWGGPRRTLENLAVLLSVCVPVVWVVSAGPFLGEVSAFVWVLPWAHAVACVCVGAAMAVHLVRRSDAVAGTGGVPQP